MVEQPLADDGMSLVNHADLQARLETPVCLDESVISLRHVEAAIRLGACRVVNVKMARVGGVEASRRSRQAGDRAQRSGEVETSRVPGIPQAPDPDLLVRWTVAHASFRA
jgi:hypothetical protein